MIERFITAISVTDVPGEDLAGTRERLKERFPRGATRRMTQLGLLVGAALDDMSPQAQDSVVYASAYAESRALEGYLDSFPSASPTLFQTSIHPSAVQQALIGRQHAVGEFFPLTGRAHLVAHALETALLSPAPRVLLCGGEERGTWLLDQNIASARSFAFALALNDRSTGALARVRLRSVSEPTPVSEYTLPEFFDALRARQTIDCAVRPGVRLELQWL
ncbi:MAG: hypothetical protein ABIV50_13905 [Opitutus sp.]